MKMKSRRSLDVKSKTTRSRKLNKRHTLDPSQISSDSQKENIEPVISFKIENQNQNPAVSTRPQRRAKKKSNYFHSDWELSLQANNRSLAAALEEARIQINASNQENVLLKRQLQGERQHHIETLRREVDIKVQEKFKVIDEYLQKTVCKLLDCTNLITSATDIICHSKPNETTNVLTPLSNTPFHSLDTTPPPDEPETMEVTSAEIIPMETTCVEMGCIDAVVSELSQRVYSTQSQVVDDSECDPHDQASGLSSCCEDNTLMSCDPVASNEAMTKRTRRSSAGNVSYVMPSLRSKLRRGDPFTDTSFREHLGNKDSSKKRRGRMSTGCIQKKPRFALSNLTNIIREEEM
ncbi:uncharacterized protein LOC114574366 [Exaiptasia diaphana]|uniref:Shugoshin C-terminal domain-containing protein n=1 Tax=Exaiptasia diaphana TaxID=2652724 RepID=A0A913YB81_EXADI|nr:uncharacterized protein LOC114574366 [Exaiptasia diaphana]